ncbi:MULTISPECIES: DUF6783 domain-containing protein [unclassified Blautia]
MILDYSVQIAGMIFQTRSRALC